LPPLDLSLMSISSPMIGGVLFPSLFATEIARVAGDPRCRMAVVNAKQMQEARAKLRRACIFKKVCAYGKNEEGWSRRCNRVIDPSARTRYAECILT
jgi:hypothetical protein